VATVIVIQSDDLAAWIGVAGVAVGVVLAAAIDWWRTRRAENKQTRLDLLRAASELAGTATAAERTNRVAGQTENDGASIEDSDARQAAMRSALVTIKIIGDRGLDEAALGIVAVAIKPMPPAEDQVAFQRRMHELSDALKVFRDAVRNAKL
jgi:hypothetical protein